MSYEEFRAAAAKDQPTKRLGARFRPKLSVNVNISVSDVFSNTNEVWYRIEVEHGEFKWDLYKKLSHILSLALRLKIHEKWKLSRSSSSEEHSVPSITDMRKLMFLRTSSEMESLERIIMDLQVYFGHVFATDEYRNHPATVKFFEISEYSFMKKLGSKSKEGYLKKKSVCFWLCPFWRKRWFVLKDSFLMALDENEKTIDGVFLFDGSSTVEKEKNNKLKLTNSSCTLTLQCDNATYAQCWKECITKMIDNVAIDLGSTMRNMHRSFAPIRHCATHWFVDGSDFFASVADAIDSAKEEILITGWMISPCIHLKRKSTLEANWILKSVLERKANEGVRIYVLVYDSPEAVIDLGENYVKAALESLSDNITVLQHRGRILDGDLLWTHHEKLVIIDQSIAFVSGLDLAFGRWDYHKHPLTDPNPETTVDESVVISDGSAVSFFCKPTWMGLDYANDYVKADKDLERPLEDYLDRHTTPRMPWHDVGVVTYQEGARDVARHFIQRWNWAKAKRHRRDEEYCFLVPMISDTEDKKGLVKAHPDATVANVQVLRSSSDWSVGLKETERSIHEAYIEAIKNAEHYIYIENQFFVSVKDDENIRNKIVTALVKRILAARGTKFRVFVIIPLIPGLEGDFSKDAESEQHQIIAYYQYISICRGNQSLFGNLLQNGLSKAELKEHISFCALRTCGELNGEAITCVLYVHSKMMVVDDKLTIIGSANINDRSMLGDRDSEVALCVIDTEFVESVMDGKTFMAGKFSSNLRKRLFAEHLGLLPADFDDEKSVFAGNEKLNDIVSDDFYHGVWKITAKENTRLYDEIFKPIPANRVRRFSQVEEYQSRVVHGETEKRNSLQKIKGYLVKFPTKYLEDENLKPELFSTLQLVPPETFT